MVIKFASKLNAVLFTFVAGVEHSSFDVPVRWYYELCSQYSAGIIHVRHRATVLFVGALGNS